MSLLVRGGASNPRRFSSSGATDRLWIIILVIITDNRVLALRGLRAMCMSLVPYDTSIVNRVIVVSPKRDYNSDFSAWRRKRPRDPSVSAPFICVCELACLLEEFDRLIATVRGCRGMRHPHG